MSRHKENAKTNATVPENRYYEDDGCQASQSCLTCPLPQCKYDNPVWFKQLMQERKDLLISNTIQAENLTVDEAAERFSMTARTVFRVLRRCQESGEAPSTVN